MDTLEDVSADIEAAAHEVDYVAVNTLWLALLKLANAEDNGSNEQARMVALVDRIPELQISAIVQAEDVDALVNLDPPLESVLTHARERLETEKVATALGKIRTQRATDVREAMSGLGFVLKTIRNKREHGFKSRRGPRDAQILSPARHLLDRLCRAALEAQRQAELLS
ncbi:MAG: hypothetical protein C0467_17250 [Planctomycetaceae bacterium]|nr:hypothetical protein [Planctomycetaceae bacterium]